VEDKGSTPRSSTLNPQSSILDPEAPTLFISDLHLNAQQPRITEQFLDFLATKTSGADALYILGDLFEYWAGDDDLGDTLNHAVTAALARFSNGAKLYFMHGNRDFLIGAGFANASGAQLLDDPQLVDLHGTPTLLMHGDTLCTDDARYQAFRKQVRDPAWQAQFLNKPLAQRKAMIDDLRKMSEQEKGGKSAAIMDVNHDAVAAALRAHHYPRMIHGHTHRPARHAHTVDGKNCERWVLPDWGTRGGYLRVSAQGCEAIG
jgi:UDP-2,3-diacylglucosamine hydrolase